FCSSIFAHTSARGSLLPMRRIRTSGVFPTRPSTSSYTAAIGESCSMYAASMSEVEEARALHDRHPAIDLHADTLLWGRWFGYDLLTRHEPPLPRKALLGHVDLPRMREGGVGAQFFGLVS